VKLLKKHSTFEITPTSEVKTPSRAGALRARPLHGAGLHDGAQVHRGPLERQHLAAGAAIALVAAHPACLVELQRPTRDDGEDLLEEREEGALHVVPRERGRLGEEEPLLLGEARGLVGRHLAPRRGHVGLVPDERHDGGAVGVRAELLHPPRDVLERGAPGAVLAGDDIMS